MQRPGTIDLFQLDAFTRHLFAGNPAAVCPLEAWPDDATLQAIAAENALSETAFLALRADGGYDLRWFTPRHEVDLCGHATLASAAVVLDTLRPGSDRALFHTRSGRLAVERDGDGFAMDLPAVAIEPVQEPPQPLLDGLRAAPDEVWASAGNYLAVFRDEATVRGLEPDLVRLEILHPRGVIVTAPGKDVDFVSRYFAPGYGIPEDPVTGSAHCLLVPYWSGRLGRTRLQARQVSARGGELLGEDRGDRVSLAGHVVPFLRGTIRLPGAGDEGRGPTGPAPLPRVTLTGRRVRLEPLGRQHLDDLADLGDDPDVWHYMGFGDLRSPDRLKTWLLDAVREPDRGVGLPFAVIDMAAGRVAGCTSLYDLHPQHLRLELGRTWLGRDFRRTGVNTECKLLLLEYAFEVLGVRRVQLKASAGNAVSRASIERLGATLEGVLRSYSVLQSQGGRSTDTAMYSILADEWPEVRDRLRERAGRTRSA